jgi:hypothetical protein
LRTDYYTRLEDLTEVEILLDFLIHVGVSTIWPILCDVEQYKFENYCQSCEKRENHCACNESYPQYDDWNDYDN